MSTPIQTHDCTLTSARARLNRAERPLPTPAELAARQRLSPRSARALREFRAQAIDIVQGRSARLLAVIGPCSIHDPIAALEYAERLRPVAERVSSELLVVMRVYLEKPRSSVGWKGLISDPDLDGRCDLVRGLSLGRRLMTQIAELGLPIASELLDINLANYQADLLTWAAIGARTTESQPHRELASALPFAVGFKNGTDGRVDGALGGMLSARQRHRRLAANRHGRIVIAESPGNSNCHLTLRGGSDGPNYAAECVARASAKAIAASLPGRVLIDCSHGNSGKDHDNQPRVLADVVGQLDDAACPVLGVMIESHLVAGRQALSHDPQVTKDMAGQACSLTYGQSITDACVDFETGERMLMALAEAVRRRAARALEHARARPC